MHASFTADGSSTMRRSEESWTIGQESWSENKETQEHTMRISLRRQWHSVQKISAQRRTPFDLVLAIEILSSLPRHPPI
eukprot:3768150-Amphidinium_carterae.2